MPERDRSDVLDDPLTLYFKQKAATLAKQYGLHTAGDLVRHFPHRYIEVNRLTELDRLPLDENVTVVAEVASASTRQMRNPPRRKGRSGDNRMMNVVVKDDAGGRLALTFFAAVGFHERRLRPGVRALFTGKVGEYRGQRQLSQPQYDLLGEEDGEATEELLQQERTRPIPIYHSTGEVDSKAIQRALTAILSTMEPLPDPVPIEIRARHGLMELNAAISAAHQPWEMREVHAARHRLRFEEAFVLQTALARRRNADHELAATPRFAQPGGLADALSQRLPFELTAGQREVGEQIANDLARSYPMHRLLQGEVGSGKTVVALRAMLTVIDSGGQAALLAPTEVLAAQHYRSIRQLLGSLAEGGMLGGDDRGTQVTLLTGSLATAPRRKALLQAASGEAGIVVGTHALLADRVQFADLGLIVVDEQHRFGVEQRDVLRGKGKTVPHVLVMTATPIPRTVAMTVFGDLETSTLRELPSGRTPIATSVVPMSNQRWVERAWQRVREEVDAGHQVFVVCPRIGDDGPAVPGVAQAVPVPAGVIDLSQDADWNRPGVVGAGGYDAGWDDGARDWDDADPSADDGPDDGPARPPGQAVVDVLAMLRELPALAGLVIEPLHGRMGTEDREENMRAFAAGDVQVLVATTVIEVGVDVPNASTMVVLDADRFGVSQLHQLRGRVGRGSVPGLCLLFTELEAGPARERLAAIAATLDGFELAQVDLENRREGDVLGRRQSGRGTLRWLRLAKDEELIKQARHEATAVVAADPSLESYPALLAALGSWFADEQDVYLERG